MKDVDFERWLGQIPADAEHGPEHKHALREELRLRLRESRPRWAAARRRRRWRRIVSAAALAACFVLSIPARYPVRIGARIVFEGDGHDGQEPTRDAMRLELASLRLAERARVWAVRTRTTSFQICVDLLDDRVDASAIADRLRHDVPELTRLGMRVEPLQATAEGRLVDRVGHELHVRPAPGAVDAARREYVSVLDRSERGGVAQ